MAFDLFNQPNMHQNSLDNWYKEIEPTLTDREIEVLKVIEKLGKCSCRMAAQSMGVFPNVISGRFTNLKEKNAIVSCGNEIVGKRKHELFKVNYEI